MEFLKIIRLKDKKVFWIATEFKSNLKYLCRKDKSIIKSLENVRQLEVRFRKFIIGVDND
jgi:hypothetical protein